MTSSSLKLTRRGMLFALGLAPLGAQQLPSEGGAPAVTANAPPAVTGPLDWYCPMDRDVRSDKPGKCPRCGMTLAFGVQEEKEYPIDITYTPAVFKAGERSEERRVGKEC